MYEMFGFLATPLGWIMRFLYGLIQNYGWTIILFTLLVRVLMFPLTLKQQKSTARMSAYQPMIQELQKKWANDKTRQNEEMQKFYEENDIKMTAGCLPTVINMLVIFGIIAVIQAPLTYILDIPADQIEKGEAIVTEITGEDIGAREYTKQSIMIGEIQKGEESKQTLIDGVGELEGMNSESVDTIYNFNFNFLGMNLAVIPTMAMNRYLILPILSVLTMFLSQIIIMRASGQAAMQGKSMLVMTLVMGVMFGYFAFTVPVGFSLYYTASNIVMTLQQLIVKRVYDPEKIKEQIVVEMEERKKAKKEKKQVAIRTDDGEIVEKELSESELMKLRLQKARELDMQRYGDAKTDDQERKDKEAREKAKKQDLEKYGLKDEKRDEDAPPLLEGPEEEPLPDDEDPAPDEDFDDLEDDAPEDEVEDEAENEAGEEPKDAAPAPQAQEYKPGRRKRARMNKDKQDETFAEKEMRLEQEAGEKESEQGE